MTRYYIIDNEGNTHGESQNREWLEARLRDMLDTDGDKYEGLELEIVDDSEEELADLKDRKEMDLAGELDEMIALGWTDEEARANPEAFLDRIGEEYKEGLTEEDIWRVWKNVLEIRKEV